MTINNGKIIMCNNNFVTLPSLAYCGFCQVCAMAFQPVLWSVCISDQLGHCIKQNRCL